MKLHIQMEEMLQDLMYLVYICRNIRSKFAKFDFNIKEEEYQQQQHASMSDN